MCCRAKVPITVLAGHGIVHVLFVVLAGIAADWAMQQQVQRIQVNENTITLERTILAYRVHTQKKDMAGPWLRLDLRAA